MKRSLPYVKNTRVKKLQWLIAVSDYLFEFIFSYKGMTTEGMMSMFLLQSPLIDALRL